MVLIFFPAAPPLVWKILIRSSAYLSSCPRNLEVKVTVVNLINSKLTCKREDRQDTDLKAAYDRIFIAKYSLVIVISVWVGLSKTPHNHFCDMRLHETL